MLHRKWFLECLSQNARLRDEISSQQLKKNKAGPFPLPIIKPKGCNQTLLCQLQPESQQQQQKHTSV